MNAFFHDLRYGLRMLAKAPGVTLLALVALAFGIGANTAIFSAVNAVLLRPLPYKDTEHLLVLSLVEEQLGARGTPLSPSDFLDFRAQNRRFQFAAFEDDTFNFSGRETPEQVQGAWTTADFFTVLGIPPLLGRGFLPNEDSRGAAAAVVLGEDFWRSRFNADPKIVGRVINLDSRQYTVVGVMPASFKFPSDKMQLWVAYQFEPQTRRGPYFLHGLLRYPPTLTLSEARAELANIAFRVRTKAPELPANYGFVSTPLNEWLVGDVRPALLVLFGAVGLVLLIASLNVANLLLSRAAARQREISIRAALGASRGRIIRQFLTETLILTTAGGLAGLMLSLWGIDLIRAFSPENVPRLPEVRVDRVVLAWTVLVSLGSGILFGIAPAWHGTRLNLNDSLKEGGRGAGGVIGGRLRSGLVVSEIALAMMLLICAGLLIRSFVRLQQVHPGFEPKQIVTMQLVIPRVKYPKRPRIADFYNRLLQRVNALPGVRSAALTMSLPPNGLQVSDTFLTETIKPVEDAKAPMGSILSTTPGYFRTLGVPILHGRDFTEHDKADTPRVVIINETLARQFFPNKDPIGARLKEGGIDRRDNPWMEIVGVAGDVKYEGLEVPTAPTYYLPFTQAPFRQMSLVIRTALPAENVVSSIRAEVRALDPEVPVARISTAEQLVSQSIAQPRLRTFLIGVFSAVAMLLAAIGIYGVVSYAVSQRTREIGIRMALGAQRRDVLQLVVRQGMTLTFLGVLFGLFGALVLARLTSSLLFGIGASDPATFVAITILLSTVALLASYIPARRAATVNPVAALAHE